jgi:hypothetical protein
MHFIISLHACPNRAFGSQAITYKLCTLEYRKKGREGAEISLSSRGTDEEAVPPVRGQFGNRNEA